MLDCDGAAGTLIELVTHGEDSVAVVELATGARVEVPAALLHVGPEGGYTIPSRWSQFAQHTGSGVSIPVVEERAVVGVRRVPSERVRVRRRVVTQDQEVHTPVWSERIEIERVARGEFVDTAPEPRQEGDTLVVPVVEEVPVVQVRLRLREEIRLRIVRERRVEQATITVRRHEVDVEREQDAEPATNEMHEGGIR